MTPTELRKFLTDSHVTDCAKRLLGCDLIAPHCRIQIVETEAYGGKDDLGSHAARGVTPRNAVMFGPAGIAYVYFNYGMHWLLNVTCRPAGEPGAVLIRAAKPIEGTDDIKSLRPKAKKDYDLLSGPGKITMALGAKGDHTGLDLIDGTSKFTIVPNNEVKTIVQTTRIGLAEGKGHELEWRFIDKENSEWASSLKSQASCF